MSEEEEERIAFMPMFPNVWDEYGDETAYWMSFYEDIEYYESFDGQMSRLVGVVKTMAYLHDYTHK